MSVKTVETKKKAYYKHPKFGHVYGELIASPVGRCCWPSLVNPKAPPPPQEGQAPGQPRYEVTVLLPKDSPKVDEFVEKISTMATEMLKLFNEGRKAKVSDIEMVQDGDAYDLEKYPFYKGCYVLVARNANNPKVINHDKPKSSVIEPKEIAGGMKVRVLVTPLITAHGLSYKLEVCQLISDDGTRFGGGQRDTIGFLDALEDGEEEIEQAKAEEDEAEEEDLKEEAPAPKKGRPPLSKGKQVSVNLL